MQIGAISIAFVILYWLKYLLVFAGGWCIPSAETSSPPDSVRRHSVLLFRDACRVVGEIGDVGAVCGDVGGGAFSQPTGDGLHCLRLYARTVSSPRSASH